MLIPTLIQVNPRLDIDELNSFPEKYFETYAVDEDERHIWLTMEIARFVGLHGMLFQSLDLDKPRVHLISPYLFRASH